MVWIEDIGDLNKTGLYSDMLEEVGDWLEVSESSV